MDLVEVINNDRLDKMSNHAVINSKGQQNTHCILGRAVSRPIKKPKGKPTCKPALIDTWTMLLLRRELLISNPD